MFNGPLEVSGNAVGFGVLWHIAPSVASVLIENIDEKSVVKATADGLLVRYRILEKLPPAGATMTSPNPFDQIASPETVLLKTVTVAAAHE